MEVKKKNIAVIGGGSWATAIVKILLHNVDHLYWWVREPEIKRGIETNGVNPLYLSSVEFPIQRLTVSNDIKEIISKVEVLVFVIPSAFFKVALQGIKPEDLQGKDICSAIKGIIPETNQVVGTFLQEVMQVDLNRLSVISGPSHAEEIALGRLTYLTSASQNEGMARRMASYFDCSYVRTRLSEDVFGIEYAAVIKNVYALAVGISKGLGYGDNFSAVLVSNALEEMKVFLERVYPIDRNLSTSVYLGDLLVTSYSQFSRNRTFGNMIGQGYSVKSTILEMKMVAEGYYASLSVHKIKEEMHINMPILEAVYDILYNHQSPSQVFSILETKFE